MCRSSSRADRAGSGVRQPRASLQVDGLGYRQGQVDAVRSACDLPRHRVRQERAEQQAAHDLDEHEVHLSRAAAGSQGLSAAGGDTRASQGSSVVARSGSAGQERAWCFRVVGVGHRVQAGEVERWQEALVQRADLDLDRPRWLEDVREHDAHREVARYRWRRGDELHSLSPRQQQALVAS